jgi:hypothetical protein
MRNLAKKENIPLVDLTQLTNDLFVKLGKETTTNTIFFPGTGSHVRKTGAIAISKLFADDIAKQKIMPICSWLKESPCAATSAKVCITNSNTPHNIVSYNSINKTLSINISGAQQLRVTVFTLNGKSVFSRVCNLQASSATIKMPFYELNYGTYLVKSVFNGEAKLDLINVVR